MGPRRGDMPLRRGDTGPRRGDMGHAAMTLLSNKGIHALPTRHGDVKSCRGDVQRVVVTHAHVAVTRQCRGDAAGRRHDVTSPRRRAVSPRRPGLHHIHKT